MEDKLFTLLGLGVPFYLAAATYAVFSWLDSNASDEATKVITAWLHGWSHNKPDLGNLIISAFDRIYTSPLLRLRAFRRSAAISTSLWLLTYFLPWSIAFTTMSTDDEGRNFINHLSSTELFAGATMTLPLIILSDYISLFVVRRLLVSALIHPIAATVGAFVIGVIIIFILLGLLEWILVIFILLVYQGQGQTDGRDPFFAIMQFILLGDSTPGIFAPAFIIHLWLPLFALSSLIVRLVSYPSRSRMGAVVPQAG